MVQVRTLEQNHLTSMQDLAELTDDDLRKLADSSVGLGASLCVCIPAYLSFFLKLCACLKEYQRGVPQCVSVPLAFDASRPAGDSVDITFEDLVALVVFFFSVSFDAV